MTATGFRSVLAALPKAPPPGAPRDPGLFGPSSLVWHLGRERVLLAGGTAALLLQVAHPLVAAGVAAHSEFPGDPLPRLGATLDATLTITFGATDQAEAAAKAVRRRHHSVHGELPAATGRFAAGTPYRAEDPDLALWVFCTLVWSAIAARDAFVGRLAPGERETYYQEIKPFAELFGITRDRLPLHHSDLDRYFHHMLHHGLAVGDAARGLAGHILSPDPPLLPRPLRGLPRLLAAALLPPRAREMYGLTWRRRDQFVYAALRAVIRAALIALPRRLRYWPHYQHAVGRMYRHSDGAVSQHPRQGTDRWSRH